MRNENENERGWMMSWDGMGWDGGMGWKGAIVVRAGICMVGMY